MPPLRKTGFSKVRLDNAGRDSQNTVFGEHIVANRRPKINVKFNYNVATYDTVTTVANNGTVTHSGDVAVISSSTTTNGSAILESKEVVQYITGQEGYAFFTAAFLNGGVADSIQHCGLFDTDDGYYLGFDGTDAIIGEKKATVQSNTKQNNWNLDHLDGTGPSGLTVDFTKMNVFKISYGWLGVAPITWEIMGPDGTLHAFHKTDHTGTLAGTHSENPTFPVSMRITKTDGATDIIIHSASWAGGTVGLPVPLALRYFSDTESATGVSTEQVLLNLQNVSTFQSKTNRVITEPVRVGLSTDGTKNALIKMYVNIPITAPSWANIDSVNSVTQKDVVGTITPDDAYLVWEYPMAKVDSLIDSFQELQSHLHPGDTLTITGQSASNTDIELAIRWTEAF